MIRSLEYYLKRESEAGRNITEEFLPILNPIPDPIKGKFPERYKLHQYWSRKPWYVVRQYIEHFTKEDDTILDSFVGSGVTACEALITRRKVIAMDLNKFKFSSILVRTSKLIFVNNYRLNKGVNPAGVWGEKRFWVPGEYVENNVLYYFRERLSKVIKAKKETNALIGNYFKEGNTFKMSTQSATDLMD